MDIISKRGRFNLKFYAYSMILEKIKPGDLISKHSGSHCVLLNALDLKSSHMTSNLGGT